MTREKFTALVTKLDRRYAHRPGALKRVTLAWTALGFAGFLLIMASRVVIGAGLALIGIMFEEHGGFLVFLLGGALLITWGLLAGIRHMWVESSPPEGVKLTRENAPILFAEIARLRSSIGSQKLHSVLLTANFNASMYQEPRLGWLGFMRNHLILGLPLLDAQTPDEIRGVIAHELTHLSGEHGRTSAWIYRLRKSWSALYDQMQQRQGAKGRKRVLEWFVNWFWPRFNTRAFVLSRANEYQADATAARCTSAAVMAGSLLRIHLSGQRLGGEFWPPFWKKARQGGSPPPDVLAQLAAFLRAPADDADGKMRRAAFRALTTNDDTHPSLSDRWRALGLTPPGPDDPLPPVPAPLEQSAAQAFFAQSLDLLRTETERTQQRALAARWAAEQAWAETQNRSLAAAEFAGDGTDDESERQWSLAQNCFALSEEDRAVSLLKTLLVSRPDHARAHLSLAAHLLEKDNPDGEVHALRVMATDDALAWPAAEMLHGYYARTGHADALAALQRRMDVMEKQQRAAGLALSKVTGRDRFKAPGLTEGSLAALRETLGRVPGLQRAWLAQKSIPGTNRRLYVLRVARSGLPSFHADLALTRRAAAAISMPGRVFVCTARTNGPLLAMKVKRTGAPVV